MALQARSGSRIQLEPRFEDFAARQARAFGVLQRAARDYSASIVYPHEALCDSAVCRIAHDGYPLYSDGNHLSVRGAEYLTPMFERVLKSGQ
jgi:hypothetical protein